MLLAAISSGVLLLSPKMMLLLAKPFFSVLMQGANSSMHNLSNTSTDGCREGEVPWQTGIFGGL